MEAVIGKTSKETSRRRNPKVGIFCPFVQSKTKHLQDTLDPKQWERSPMTTGKGERLEWENPFPGELQGLLSMIIPQLSILSGNLTGSWKNPIPDELQGLQSMIIPQFSVLDGNFTRNCENPFPAELPHLPSMIIPSFSILGGNLTGSWTLQLFLTLIPKPEHFLDFLLGMCPVWGSPSTAKSSWTGEGEQDTGNPWRPSGSAWKSPETSTGPFQPGLFQDSGIPGCLDLSQALRPSVAVTRRDPQGKMDENGLCSHQWNSLLLIFFIPIMFYSIFLFPPLLYFPFSYYFLF